MNDFDRWAAIPRYRYDPAAFVTDALPFGRAGTDWERWQGLWPWQREFFDSVGAEAREKEWGKPRADGEFVKPAIQRVVSSCTGSGKTSLVLPGLLFWAMAVFPTLRAHCISTTREQLMDRFFNACKVMLRNSPKLDGLFEFMLSGKIMRRSSPEVNVATFRAAATPEALQGLHGHGGMTLVLFDEASGIERPFWDATTGPRADPQAIVCAMGNPTKGDGWYWDRHSGRLAKNWKPMFISQKDLPGWSDARERELIEDHGGEDTDSYRYGILGLPPEEGSGGIMPRRLVEACMRRPLVDDRGRPLVPVSTPVVAGMDLARAGENLNYCCFTAGIDGRTIQSRWAKGVDTSPEDRVHWAVSCATEPCHPYGAPSVVYYDAGGGDGFFEMELQRYPCAEKFIPVVFHKKSLVAGSTCGNQKAEMFLGWRRWMFKGGAMSWDPEMLRLLTGVQQIWEKNDKRWTLTKKQDLRTRFGGSRLDEADARMLSVLPPPEDGLPARVPAVRVPAGTLPAFAGMGPGRRSWKG